MPGLTPALIKNVGSFERLHIHPNIPVPKLAAARLAHGFNLPEGERVLALFDSTAFGGAREGFVLTTQRICWKNIFAQPGTLPLVSIQPTEMHVSGKNLQLFAGEEGMLDLSMEPELAAPLMALLRQVAGVSVPEPVAEDEPFEGGPLETFIHEQLSTRLSALPGLHVGTAVPPAKRSKVEGIHGVLQHAKLLALYDDTVFGSATDGFVITATHVSWKNTMMAPQAVAWTDLSPRALAPQEHGVTLGGGRELMLSGKQEHLGEVCAVLRDIIVEAKRLKRLGPGVRCEYCSVELTVESTHCPSCGAPR